MPENLILNLVILAQIIKELFTSPGTGFIPGIKLGNFRYFFLAIFFLGSYAHSVALSESAIYFRCHSQFVRSRPPAGDELLASIKAGKLTATEACLQLLSESNLDHTGKPKKELQPDDRGLQILRTFQAFHMTWFPNKELVRQETEILTANIYDSNEMGYHLTFNLFGDDTSYSEIVTRPTSFRGVRYAPRPGTHLLEPDNDGRFPLLADKKWNLFTEDSLSKTWTPQFIETGKLVGLRPLTAEENYVRMSASKKKVPKGQKLEFSASASLGAGILGTAPYLLLNSHESTKFIDGGLVMHRGWSKAVFSDLLCRSLPVLRKEDVAYTIQKESHLPFRKSETCMQCHSTIDPAASTVRQVTVVKLLGVDKAVNSPRMMGMFDVTEAPEIELPDSDEQYYLRPPQGRLNFRNYKGELVDQKLSGLKDLGVALAQSDDLYLCAAKRYFEFMTGVNVEIGDFTTDDFANVSQEELGYRNFVINLGLNLKKHQSLKKMIQEIISSPIYRKSDYGIVL